MKALFQSRMDGEYCLCKICAARGYGEDAWHPATSEFWRIFKGRLLLSRCRACDADVAAKICGIVDIASHCHLAQVKSA